MEKQQDVSSHKPTIKSGASDRLLTRDEVAAYLNIGTTFIENLRRQGKLPSYRLSNKCVRYKKSDCDILLAHALIGSPTKKD